MTCELADVRALRGRELAHSETRREQELPALEERRRIRQLGYLHPRDLVPQAVQTGHSGQFKAGNVDEILNAEHGRGFDAGAKNTTTVATRKQQASSQLYIVASCRLRFGRAGT
jgi:hypothetical protein